MHFIRLSAIAVCFVLSALAHAADTYQVDPAHSTFLFRVKHLNASNFYGRINNGAGTLLIDEADPSKSSVEIALKPENVDTANEGRDKHLKGPDFFNSKQFPTLSFKSTSIKKLDDTNFEVSGQMTLLGVSKEVSAKFARVGSGKDPWGGFRVGFEGTFTIKRSDFGMKQMLDAIGDEIQITASIEAAKK